MKTNSSFLLCILLMLPGCMVGKDYERPPYEVDNAWDALEQKGIENSNITYKVNKEDTVFWWELFDDEVMTSLIKEAMDNNHDLKAAEARIKEARANEDLLTARLFPEVTAVGSKSRGTQGGSFGDSLETSKRYGLQGSWELDLFGGNRRRLEGAEYRTKQSIAEYDDIRRQLIAEVARNYVQLRGLQQQREIVLRNLGLQRSTLNITQEQRRESVVSQLDVLRARAQADNTKSRLPSIDLGIHSAINRITVLVAGSPADMRKRLEESKPIPNVPRHVITSLPLSIIGQRPDVKAAEWQLAEATAISGAALAEFFPDISLEGFIGKSKSSVFGNLSPWSIGADIALTLLDFGRIQAGVDSANAREDQAYHNFKQAVLLAVEDMEVSLSAYLNELEREAILRSVSNAQVQAVVIAKEQYFAGIAPQLDLLQAETNALNAESEMVNSRVTATQNAILLFAALGENGVAKIEEEEEWLNEPVVIIDDAIVNEAIAEAEQQSNININTQSDEN